jgi:hypothetical protein
LRIWRRPERGKEMRMNAPARSAGRLSAYVQFLAAVLYFILARTLARQGAEGLANEQWSPLAEQAMLVFLLLLGYAAMGFWLNGQADPAREQGLPLRRGWPGEAGMGMAVGWGLAVACVLPMALIGGIVVSVSAGSSAWGWLAADTAFFALAALAEEIAFRGYGFQRFVDAIGPIWATLGFAAYYAVVQSFLPGSNRASLAVSLALGLVLSAAYLRTRALWVSWGVNFGWKTSRALLFGLTISGVSAHSPVIEGVPMGPFWLTGGGFGLDGSWFAFLALLAALPVIFKVTRDLDFRYNAPVIVPAGIPVDLDVAARAQHEAAMGTADAVSPPLVQIGPAATLATAVRREESPAGHTPDSQ